MWLIFALSLTIGALTAYGYYYHDPYQGVSCYDCPKVAKNKPNPKQECKICCGAKCEDTESREKCLTQCDSLPEN